VLPNGIAAGEFLADDGTVKCALVTHSETDQDAAK
jgi:hypothetical protein